METNDRALYKDPWHKSGLAKEHNRIYICVSGNSGAGKSTLVKSIATNLLAISDQTIAIDEKSLHHPFISKLFYETKSYGFLIQLNFMLQRVLLVKHWLDNGYNVVMERSHLEDIIFIRHLQNLGYVNEEEYKTYTELWSRLDQRLPRPDVMLFLDVSPETSLQRLCEDEASGRRPREFPDDETKETWIRSWYNLYLERLLELKNNIDGNMKLLVVHEASNIDDVCRQVLREVGL